MQVTKWLDWFILGVAVIGLVIVLLFVTGNLG